MTGLRYDVLDSPVGTLLAATSEFGLAWLGYERPGHDSVPALDALTDGPLERAPAALTDVRRQLDEYFTGRRRAFDLPLDWSLGPPGFAGQALKVVASIAYGETLTYGEVAAEAGSPGAARAVGNAMRANVMAIVVPCHRVVHAGGGIGGYMGGEANGLSIKRHLLALEGLPF